MTVFNTEVPRKLYPGDGVAVTFPIPFDYDPNEPAITVVFIDDQGQETELTEGSSADYTFDPDAGEFTIINLIYRPEVGEYLAAFRDTELTQEIGIKHARAYDAELYEDTLDKNIRALQESVLNALRVPGTTTEIFDTEIGTPEAGKALVINDTLTQVIMGPTATEIENAEQSAQNAAASAAAAEQSAQEAAEAFQTDRTWVKIQNYQPFLTAIAGGVVDWDGNKYPVLDILLDQDITLNAPTVVTTPELTTVDSIGLLLRVENQASWTITFNIKYKFGGAIIQPVANGATSYVWVYNLANDEWQLMGNHQGA